MSAITQSYPSHLSNNQAASGNSHGTFFAWLFANRNSENTMTVASELPNLALERARPAKAAPVPMVLRLSKSVAAELTLALQQAALARPSDANHPNENQKQLTKICSYRRQYSTSILETEDRDFPIV
jgi:hypothetical protein